MLPLLILIFSVAASVFVTGHGFIFVVFILLIKHQVILFYVLIIAKWLRCCSTASQIIICILDILFDAVPLPLEVRPTTMASTAIAAEQVRVTLCMIIKIIDEILRTISLLNVHELRDEALRARWAGPL